MKENGIYEISSWRYRATCTARWPRENAERWIIDPASCFASGSPGPKSSQATLVPQAPPAGKIFVKRHRRPLHKALADALVRRPSPASRGFRVGRVLERAAVNAVRPLAAVNRRWPGLSFLILDHVEGVTLRDHLLSRMGGVEREIDRDRIKSALWRSLAPCLARLHAATVRQRDLKALNIIVEESTHPDDPPRVTLVDLEGMHHLGTLPDPRRRARDLSRLAASLLTDEVRAAGFSSSDWEDFLGHYLDASRAAFPAERDLKWWADTTLEWAEKKVDRYRREGRPLR